MVRVLASPSAPYPANLNAPIKRVSFSEPVAAWPAPKNAVAMFTMSSAVSMSQANVPSSFRFARRLESRGTLDQRASIIECATPNEGALAKIRTTGSPR
jgi:hypothetical protein